METNLHFRPSSSASNPKLQAKRVLPRMRDKISSLFFRSPPCNKNHKLWISKPTIENKGRIFKKSCTLPTHGSTRLLCHLRDTKNIYIYNLSLPPGAAIMCKKSTCAEFGLLIEIDSQCSLHVEVSVLCKAIKNLNGLSSSRRLLAKAC